MEYMDRSIRFCVAFRIRAVVDHTCECGIAGSCLKRDKCLSQANKTTHLLWVPQWKQEPRASCRIRCSWKKSAVMGCCSDSPPVHETLCVCLNASLGTILKASMEGQDPDKRKKRFWSSVMTWGLCSRRPGQICPDLHHWLNHRTIES